MRHPATTALLAALLAPVLLSPAAAGDNVPIRERQKLMRSLGKGMSTATKMVQGKLAYDPAQVADAVKTMQSVAHDFPSLFPNGTDSENAMIEFGIESEALPAIWTHMDDFKAKAEALGAAAKAAEPLTGDKAKFAGALGAIGKACKACHTDYRKPED
jgi:cytochrome c556